MFLSGVAFLQPSVNTPQPRRRLNWPGRRPNLNAERNAPAHVPQQRPPRESPERSPKTPPGPRGRLRVGDPLPTLSVTPRPAVSQAAPVAPGDELALRLSRFAHAGEFASVERYLLGGATLSAS
jgi:hypothetical protein